VYSTRFRATSVYRSVKTASGFPRLAWSNLAAQSAEQIGLAATPLVAVLALGAGAGETGFLQTAQTLPFLILAIPAGLLADRMPRRRLMAVAEAVRAGSLIVTLLLAQTGRLTLSWLALLGFAGACGTVAYSVTAPSLVPPEGLAAANARLELARTAAFVGGPAVAGALVGWTGASAAFGLAAALSTGGVILLAGLSEPARAVVASGHPLADLREGAGFMLRHSLLLPILITQFVFNTAFFVLQAVYVPYAVHHLGLSATQVGATLATYGVGMVLGALLAGRVIGALSFGVVIVIGPVAGLAAALLMVTTIWVPPLPLAAASFFVMGMGPILWVISTTTLRQTVTPSHLLGRVSAINIAAYGSRPLGAAIGGFVGGLYGAEIAIVVAAAGFLVQAVVILTSPVLRLARQPRLAD